MAETSNSAQPGGARGKGWPAAVGQTDAKSNETHTRDHIDAAGRLGEQPQSHSQAEPELKLSPSEQRGHNLAMRVAGTRRGGKSTQKALAAIALGFELFVIFLGALAFYGMKVFQPAWLGLVIGGGLCVLVIVALATLRFGKTGIILGWIVQALFCGSAILLPGVIFPALTFCALWVYCLYKGAQVDHQRRIHEANLKLDAVE